MRVLSAAALAVLMTSSAYAADLTNEPAPAPVESAAFSWTGFYAGVHGGYGWGDVDYNFKDDGHYNDEPGDRFGHSVDGGVFGRQVGYNHQIDNLVLGVAASLSWSDIGKSNISNPFDDSFAETKVDWFGTITPRIGYAFDRAQIFAKGGLAFGRVSNHFHDEFDYVETGSTRTGWTVGAGVEYAVTKKTSARRRTTMPISAATTSMRRSSKYMTATRPTASPTTTSTRTSARSPRRSADKF